MHVLKSFILLLSVIGISSCTNPVVKQEREKTEVTVQESKIKRKDLVGKWLVYRTEIISGRYNPTNNYKPIWSKNFADDSLILELFQDSTMKLNSMESGTWIFQNDSLEFLGSNKNEFPFSIDAVYFMQEGYFNQNWYLTSMFYSTKKEVSHSIRILLRRLK